MTGWTGFRLTAGLLTLAFAAIRVTAYEHGPAGAEHEAPAPAEHAAPAEQAAPTEHAAVEPASADHASAEHASTEQAPAAHAEEKHPAPAAHAPAKEHSVPASQKKSAAAPGHVTAADEMHKEARSMLTLGANLAERGDFAASEIAYWQILKDRSYPDADQRDALIGLARMHRKQGAYTKASAVYEKFLKSYADDARVPDALLELGRCQRAMGAYKNALNRFYSVINSTLKLPPESYEHYQLLAKTAQFEIAETHYETGNYVDAAKFFDRLRLLDLAPEDRARAHFKSASALMKAGEIEKAATKFSQYIEQWPQDENVPEARYQLALSLRQLGRTDEALTITLTLLRTEQANAGTDPKTWTYWQRRTGNQLANDFFQSGDTLSALAIYDGLSRLSDAVSWRMPILYQMGLCYERLRQAERATAAYKEIITAANQPAGKDSVSSELTELARMATWRIGQLEWNGRTDSQLTSFFSSSSPAPSTPQPKPVAAPANDAHESPAAAPRSL